MSAKISREEAIRILEAVQKEMNTYKEQLNKLQEMGDILNQDVLECGQLAIGQSKTDSGRRSFVRAVFALIEGTVFNLKQMALKLSEHGRGNFSKAELAMLEENTYDLDEKGKVQTQTKFIKLPRNVKFAFDAVTRAFGTSYDLKVDDTGWNSFQEALKIRNRITHPKSIGDLHLSEEEIDVVEKTASWFLRNQGNLLRTLIGKMQLISDRFDEGRQQKVPPA